MGYVARMVWQRYLWLMRYEIAKARIPKDLAVINATPRAYQFWFLCELIFAVPIVLVLMFAWTL